MKFLIISLLILFIILLCGAWFVARRPALVASGRINGEFKFWIRVSAEEKTEILEAYKFIKDKMPETLIKVTKARGWGNSEISSATIYIVKDKDWIYFFADSYPYKAPGLEVLSRRSIHSVHYNLKTKKFYFNS